MANAVQYNTALDPDETVTFGFEFLNDDDSVMSVSDSTFVLQMKDSNGNVIWDIQNANFSRPYTNWIEFTKTFTQVTALVVGLYSVSLKRTNSVSFNDEILYGTFQR